MKKSGKYESKQPKRFAREWLLPILWAYIYWCENIVRATADKAFCPSGLLLTAVFSLAAALAVYGLCSIFPQRVNRVLGRILVIVLFLFYAAQMIYYANFRCFFNLYSMGNGGQVVEFWHVIVKVLWEKLSPFLYLLVPTVLLVIFSGRFARPAIRKWYFRLGAFLLALCVHFGAVAMLPLLCRIR